METTAMNKKERINETILFKQEAFGKLLQKVVKIDSYIPAVILTILDKMKIDGTTEVNKDAIASDVKISTKRVVKAIEVLQSVHLIRYTDGKWRYNPFIFCLPEHSNEDIRSIQNKWKENK